MKYIDILKSIILEFKDCKNWSPNFMTSKNNIQISFTFKAIDLLNNLAKELFKNDKDFVTTDFNNFLKITKQCIVDFYTEDKLNNLQNSSEIISALKKYIKESVLKEIKQFTYYIPVRTLGFEQIQDFSFGSIKITSQKNLILNEIDILNNENYQKINYKKYIEDYINNSSDIEKLGEPFNWELDQLSNAIKVSKSFIKIDIQGYDNKLSFQLANIIAKTTLDSISLLVGNKDLFFQQILISDKSLPTLNYKLLKVDKRLTLPGISLSSIIPMISPKKVLEIINKNKIFVDAISKVLISLKDSSKSHTRLANRWTTALNWYAEGIREDSDAIALTKFATSLDVLSKGGKYKGILSMLKKIFNINEDDTVAKDLSLKDFVKNIYDNERSKILHGTEYERLKSFNYQKNTYIPIIRCILLISLEELYRFQGEDFDGSFIKIIEDNTKIKELQ